MIGHRRGFRAYWHWKSSRVGGRPKIEREIRDLTRGARVLVTAGGVPLATVSKIQLHRLGSNRKGISIDKVNNATLQTVSQTAPCASFQFHREWGGVTNPIQLTAGDYQITVDATVNGKKRSQTISVTLGTCDFNQNIVVAF
jgi:hypothetical protein